MLLTGKESKDTRLMRLLEELIDTLATAQSKPVPATQQPAVVKVEPVVRAWTFNVVRDSEGKISKINATPTLVTL